jgi:uncharacterized membrane protein YccC
MASNQFKQLLFSQYITNGAEVAVGVGLVALGVGSFFGVPEAVTAASGALCISIVDLPAPVRLKVMQIWSGVLFTTVITCLVAYARFSPWTEFIAVILVSVFSAMLNAFGKKALALSFVCLFAMVLGVGTPKAPGFEIEHTLRFAGGAVLYALYAMIMANLLRFRTKQQALADSVSELANYLDAKAAFFESDADINQCYGALVAEQVTLVDKQQTARDLIYRHMRGPRHVRLATILIGALDISERVFSSHTDYAAIHQHFAKADVTMLIRDLAQKAATDLRRIGYAVLRGREARHGVIYKAEIIAIEHELARLENEPMPEEQRGALDALDGVYRRLRTAIGLIDELHELVRAAPGQRSIPAGLALVPFVSNMSFSPRLMLREFKVTSPVFRFSVRLTLAMSAGFALSQFLPYATHSYWILLTTAVILRANYSVTKQRRNDRILGTLVGCIFIAGLLQLRPGYAAEVVVMLFALGIAHTFATLIYRYTAAAACVMAVLQVHFLNPGAPFAISERLIDTLVGAAIAFAASYVLPSWEHGSINKLVGDLLRSLSRYATVLAAADTPDGQYRLARKTLFDTIALTSAAFRRMLLEPRAQQRAVAQMNDFITTSYAFASNLAALRLLLENDSERDLPDVSQKLNDIARFVGTSPGKLDQHALEVPADLPAADIEDRPQPQLIDQLHHPHLAVLRRLRVIQEQGQRLQTLALAIRAAIDERDRDVAARDSQLVGSAS